ncbi:metal-dependent hydrolase [Paenibacillus sp. FSL R7-269]|uniref:metal-dependent hydrolase n=1 Tax=Paenibacillus sp. FSL R7-269 TaxID=1226755 RepID=UPI0004BB798B|nr:metal-dependent hydrolase [Paenibacillus sp. FSL R7-269]
MNRQGHIGMAILAGSAVLYVMPALSIVPAALVIAAAGIGGLLPDLDHKTSTVSNKLQFSAKTRKKLKGMSVLSLGMGIMWFVLQQPVPWLWAAAALIFALASRLRMLLLSGFGLLLLAGYELYSLHWLILLTGVALLVMPFVKHRGIIHSPEFAGALSLGVVSFTATQPVLFQALGLGLLAGWWSHLAGDAVTVEGIRSAVLPRLKVALNLLRNGGAAERWIARSCWLCSITLWLIIFY